MTSGPQVFLTTSADGTLATSQSDGAPIRPNRAEHRIDCQVGQGPLRTAACHPE